MVTYVRWYWADEELWCYDELDDERWSARHLEVRPADRTFLAASSQAELTRAREAGGPAASAAYEARYGVVPEAAFPTVTAADEPAIEVVEAAEFERLWAEGRRSRGDRP